MVGALRLQTAIVFRHLLPDPWHGARDLRVVHISPQLSSSSTFYITYLAGLPLQSRVRLGSRTALHRAGAGRMRGDWVSRDLGAQQAVAVTKNVLHWQAAIAVASGWSSDSSYVSKLQELYKLEDKTLRHGRILPRKDVRVGVVVPDRPGARAAVSDGEGATAECANAV